jgi:hypothetical protein
LLLKGSVLGWHLHPADLGNGQLLTVWTTDAKRDFADFFRARQGTALEAGRVGLGAGNVARSGGFVGVPRLSVSRLIAQARAVEVAVVG